MALDKKMPDARWLVGKGLDVINQSLSDNLDVLRDHDEENR
jgi:hypothetical protein